MKTRTVVRLISTTLRKSVRESIGATIGPNAASRLIVSMIGHKDREHLVVVHLSTQQHPTGIEIVGIGDLSTAVVHPREVFKSAILANAASIVVGHNHPSADLTPSVDDYVIARNLRLAGVILGIPVIDFLIVSQDRCQSVPVGGPVTTLGRTSK
jgi:DNA repair protein RadC